MAIDAVRCASGGTAGTVSGSGSARVGACAASQSELPAAPTATTGTSSKSAVINGHTCNFITKAENDAIVARVDGGAAFVERIATIMAGAANADLRLYAPYVRDYDNTLKLLKVLQEG